MAALPSTRNSRLMSGMTDVGHDDGPPIGARCRRYAYGFFGVL